MRRAPLAILLSLLLSLGTVEVLGSETTAAATGSVQGVVDEYRGLLGLKPVVRVVLVEENPRVVSVARDTRTPGTFVMSFARRFLAELTADEVRAVVAHELGHVWIFGNHPYLQTEQRANEVALRLVTRAELESAYRKLDAVGGKNAGIARRP
jgi:ABC-type hemin transport system substrate-binding protein